MPATSPPIQYLSAYPSGCFRVVEGVNTGDPVSIAEDIVLDDAYALDAQARPARMGLCAIGEDRFRIARNTDLGTAGNLLHPDCALTLMSPDGQASDAIVLVEVDNSGDVAGIYLLPLAPLRPRTQYSVVGIDINAAKMKVAQVACVSFTRGSRITLSTGTQVPVENLKTGDLVLTRDDGAQSIRWIGQTTMRATGAFAPIRIAAGTLSNDRDLVISPNHHLFIYQRNDTIGAGRPEIMIKARHLVNDTTVQVQSGGFVDYFQLLLDRHQIIYVEGIAAETMLVNARTRPVLPKDLSDRLGLVIPGHTDHPHHGLEVDKSLLDRPDAAEALRRSSTG